MWKNLRGCFDQKQSSKVEFGTIIKGEARLLDSTVGHVVSLLVVAHARAESELEASVEKLFDEGRSVDQVDSDAGGGQEAEVGIAAGVRIVAEENLAAKRPRRLRKKRQAITNAGGSSHPPKKLRGDYGTSSEVAICGKSPSALRELLASSLLIVEVGVAAMPTLPMVTSSVSATLEHESGAPVDSITGPNFCTVGASERFVISSDSSHHSSTHASEAEGDSFIKSDVVPPVMTEAVVTSYAVDIPPVQEMGVKKLRCGQSIVLASGREVTKKKHVIEIDSLKQNNVALENEKGSLDEKVVELQSLVSTKDLDLKELNDVYSSHGSQKDGLVSQMHELEVTCSGLRERLSRYKNLTDRLEEFQDAQLKVVNDNVAKLDADLAEIACHLKEKFHPYLLTTISDQRTDHGREGRSLTDVAAYNPSIKADFNSDLQELHELDYPLLSKLKSHKDESVKDIINLLRLEGPLVDAPGSTWGDLSNLIGEASTSASVPAATITTTTLSTSFASASFIPPITVDDYEIVHVDGQESPQGNV
uniref:Transposase (Putative), gypsy type n=1 Tax=Tanacetum cinerariifolium TaxID=118510 RepID=A0A6L2J7L6_TANCI|nr:hypothetical protein [Tanacetum cinerariifolium]